MIRVVVSSLTHRLRPTETELCQLLAYGKDASNGCPRTIWFSEGEIQWIKGGVSKQATVIYTPVGDMDTGSRVNHWVNADAVVLLMDSYVDHEWVEQMKKLEKIKSNVPVPVIGIIPWEYKKDSIVPIEELPYVVRPYTVINSSKKLRRKVCRQLCKIVEGLQAIPKVEEKETKETKETYDGVLQGIQIV